VIKEKINKKKKKEEKQQREKKNYIIIYYIHRYLFNSYFKIKKSC
jgi:hypothetical protein